MNGGKMDCEPTTTKLYDTMVVYGWRPRHTGDETELEPEHTTSSLNYFLYTPNNVFPPQEIPSL